MKKPKKRRREYGPADFQKMMRGMAEAARRIKREEKALKGPLASERLQ